MAALLAGALCLLWPGIFADLPADKRFEVCLACTTPTAPCRRGGSWIDHQRGTPPWRCLQPLAARRLSICDRSCIQRTACVYRQPLRSTTPMRIDMISASTICISSVSCSRLSKSPQSAGRWPVHRLEVARAVVCPHGKAGLAQRCAEETMRERKPTAGAGCCGGAVARGCLQQLQWVVWRRRHPRHDHRCGAALR